MQQIEQKYTILVTGPPLIKRVDAEIAIKLHEKEIETIYYTPKGIIGCDSQYLRNVKAPDNLILRIWRFFQLLCTIHPDHVEMYIANPYFTLSFYALFTRLLGYSLVTWCRGSEILDFESRSLYRRIITRFVFRLSNMLFIKEIKMLTEVARLRLASSDKLCFLPNKVPIYPTYSVARNSKIVLFLNAPQVWRHPEIIIHGIPLVLAHVPDAKFLFVGVRSEIERERVLNYAVETGVEHHIEIFPYDPNARDHYESASLFVLPAERVFLNHSLLEAMERGVPPLVADFDPNVHEIVEHGISGLVLPLDPQVWADAIVKLLKNESLRRKIGEAARQKIIQDFSVDRKVEELLEIYKKHIWKESEGIPCKKAR
jgi:glycosyltransferase involved in cell wall biosynthesis